MRAHTHTHAHAHTRTHAHRLPQPRAAGEQAQDIGGVSRDLLSALTQQLCAPSSGLFRRAGPGGAHLYPGAGPCGAARLRRYRLVGQVMAKVGAAQAGRAPGALGVDLDLEGALQQISHRP